MRLFVAIDVPEDVRAVFAKFLTELRALAPEVKWARPENLHVTLKFLGNTEQGRLKSIQDALSTVRAASPVELEFRTLGFFPNERGARVFWAGVAASQNLAPLAADVDRAVHTLGFALETRPFAPHLTLARLNSPRFPARAAAFAGDAAQRSFGSCAARDFHLIESKTKPTGAEYTTLHSFAFVAED